MQQTLAPRHQLQLELLLELPLLPPQEVEQQQQQLQQLQQHPRQRPSLQKVQWPFVVLASKMQPLPPPLSLLLLLGLAGAGAGQQTGFQYQVTSVALTTQASIPGNAFAVGLSVTVQPPSGSRFAPSLTVSAFYNGSGTFVFRFSPDVTGAWSWRSLCAQVPDLSGRAGVVQVLGNPSPAAHGAVLVNPAHPHHFIFEDGSRYLMVAFEADWLWAPGLEPDTTVPESSPTVDRSSLPLRFARLFASPA